MYLGDFRALEAIVGCRVGTRPARGRVNSSSLLASTGSAGIATQAAHSLWIVWAAIPSCQARHAYGCDGDRTIWRLTNLSVTKSTAHSMGENTHLILETWSKAYGWGKRDQRKERITVFSLKEHAVRQLSEYFCLDEETSAALSLAKLLFTDGYRQCRDESGQSTESKWLMSS